MSELLTLQDLLNRRMYGGERFLVLNGGDMGSVSDGYHTFDELYAHRCHLYAALLRAYPEKAWWSRKHSDGSSMAGWIIAGMMLPSGPITYHLPETMVDLLDGITELEVGREWDGHTSADVVNRLRAWLAPSEGESAHER